MSFHRVTGLVAALYIETSPRMLGGVQTSTRWRTPMTWFATRTLLTVGLLVGLGGACVHRQETSTSPAPPSSVVTAEDIARPPRPPIEQGLMGRLPRGTVTRGVDGRPSLRLRGPPPIPPRHEPPY